MNTTKETGSWYYWKNKKGQTIRTYRHSQDDLLRGQCSGIPECCITFFVTKWRVNGELQPIKSSYWNQIQKAKKRLNLTCSELQYIPCPDCLTAGVFVCIRFCDGPHCFCGQWENSEVYSED